MSSPAPPESTNDNVRTFEDTYPVRKHKDVYRYRVTLPRQMFDEANVHDQDRLGVRLDHVNGRAVIIYTTDLDNSALTFSASKHTSGEMSIPGAVASTLHLEDSVVTWKSVTRDDGHFEFHATTDAHLPQLDTSQSIPLESKPLKHVTQNVTWQGDEWNQEHFQLYLNSKQTKRLGWTDGSSIGIELVRVNNVPSIRLTPDTDDIDPKSVKEVQWTNRSYHQKAEESKLRSGPDALLFIPNGIVRSLEFVDRDLAWVALENELVLVPISQ